MLIRVRCQNCGCRFKVRPERAGQRGVCPNRECRAEFVVPRPTPEELEKLALGQSEVLAVPSDSQRETAAPSGKSTRIEPVAVERPSRPAALPAKPVSRPMAARRPAEETRPRSVKRRSGKKRRTARWQWIAMVTALVSCVALGLFGFFDPFGGASPVGPDLAAAAATPDNAAPAPQPVEVVFRDIQPFFAQYCYDCHSGDEAEAGFALDRFHDTPDILARRKQWERVLQLVQLGNMPPADSAQPTDAERDRTVAWLDRTLFYVDCSANPPAGHVTTRRLNRTEYNNTIRDLVGVDFQPAADFPSDDVGYGFDNIGDVLTVPPLLIEKYLTAAEQIAERAILTSNPNVTTELARGSDLRPEGSARIDGDELRINSQGSGRKRFEFAKTGEYLVRITASATQGGDEPARMRVAVDDTEVKVFDIEGHEVQQVYEVRTPVTAGRQRIEVAFINDYYNPEEREDRNLVVHAVEVHGPLGVDLDLPASHRRLIVATPSENKSIDDAARENLRPFLRRAFRRPVDDAEVAQYARFVSLATDRGGNFEHGMQIALQAVLVSPEFLFRLEAEPEGQDANAARPLNDFELASRLSYFLWSSMPDDELLAVAESGMLKDPRVLEQQSRRMLADPRADALITNFAGQWLGLRKLATNEVQPDPAVFPDFNDDLRRDIWQETERFFGSIVRDDRPVTELLNARYSFLNERLAKLYGVDGVEGDAFRRFEFKDDRRGGLITQASILTLTSYPARTSPVKRGEWVLANLLGDKPPDPPPVVPALDATQAAHPDLTLREQLVLHRADPGCASCHKVMDEIGFGLESFDAIGRWRDMDGPHPVDSRGTLPTGETFSGPAELIRILAGREEEFARCLAEKLLTYGLGRGLEYYDRCAVDDIVARMRANDLRFSSLVEGIVLSRPFRYQGSRPETE